MITRGWVDPARYGRTHSGYRTERALSTFARHIRLQRPTEVYDQASVGNCVAQACAFGAVMVAMRQGYPAERPDRTDLYHVGRQAIGTVAEDSGCIGADVLARMKLNTWSAEVTPP